jgi:hypothetical protein
MSNVTNKWRETGRIVSAIALLLAFQAGGRADEPTVAQALDILEAAVRSVKSFDVTYKATDRRFIALEVKMVKGPDAREPEPQVIGSRKLSPHEKRPESYQWFRYVFEDGKGRFEELTGERREVLQRVTVYDGEVDRSWSPGRRSGSLQEPESAALPDGYDYLSSFRFSVQRVDLVRCLRERKHVSLRGSLSRGEKLTLEAAPEPGANVAWPEDGILVHLDPKHGFMPGSIEITEPRNGRTLVTIRRIVDEWKALPGGTWIPLKVRTQHFDTGNDTFGELYNEVILVPDPATSSWNRGVPEGSFQLTFPAGTRVIDGRREVEYVTGRPETGENLEEIAKHAQEFLPFAESSGRTRRLSLGWAAGIITTVLVGLAAVLIKRRRLRHLAS